MGAGLRRTLPLLAVALSFACNRAPGRLAVVGGSTVTVGQLAAFVTAQTGRSMVEVSPELTAALFERYLEEEVILAAAPNRGGQELSPTARSARVRELMLSLCPPPAPPAEAHVTAYIAHHPELVNGGERIRLRQLILPDRPTGMTARERVRSGEDFVAVSRALSRAPNAENGGLLGWVERGQLAPEFEAAVFGLAPGEVSEPVQSNAGWHVFQVMERRGPGDGVDVSVRDKVRSQLAAQTAEDARRACLQKLAVQVGVRVDCAGAPFPCRNPFEGTT